VGDAEDPGKPFLDGLDEGPLRARERAAPDRRGQRLELLPPRVRPEASWSEAASSAFPQAVSGDSSLAPFLRLGGYVLPANLRRARLAKEPVGQEACKEPQVSRTVLQTFILERPSSRTSSVAGYSETVAPLRSSFPASRQPPEIPLPEPSSPRPHSCDIHGNSWYRSQVSAVAPVGT